MDTLYASCRVIITDCVMAELEKLGTKYRIALRIARDERWERVSCAHKGVYAVSKSSIFAPPHGKVSLFRGGFHRCVG